MITNHSPEPQFILKILDAEMPLVVTKIKIHEKISENFLISIKFASKKNLDFSQIKLQECCLKIDNNQPNLADERLFHGIVKSLARKEKVGDYFLFEAEIVPELWLLSLKENCRIFQDQGIEEIISTILIEQNISSDFYEFRFTRKDIFIKFSIQYQETDYNYINRLIEKEGIYYFFEHFEDRHVLVFCDSNSFCKNIIGQVELPYNVHGTLLQTEHVHNFVFDEQICSGKVSLNNYNFKTPYINLTAYNESEASTDLEVYEYPGPFGDYDKGNEISKIRLEELQRDSIYAIGKSCCPRLQPGSTFTLTNHPIANLNRDYLIIEVLHKGEQPQSLEEHGANDTDSYLNVFTVIPAKNEFRPARTTNKPMVPGLLSAIVTGPEGEEIWPDEYGRVNVQFHFDREGQRNEKSSCWLRVVQFWNGATWGSQFIPRIGDEVLVSFVNGDMDYPIIIGSGTNAAMQPNYNLPANKTQSGIRTRSTPGGNPDNFNELRFEDKKDHEEVFLQAEKDWNIRVKNDKSQYVGHDEALDVRNNRTKTVGVDQTVNIGSNHTETTGANRNETVGRNKTELVKINSMETIGAAKELSIGGLYQISVGGAMNETVAGAKAEEVGLAKAVFVGKTMDENVVGSRTSKVGENFTETVNKKHYSKADEFVIEASKITLKSGSSTIVIDGNSITFKASKISGN